jgi:hypothetical protein
MRIVDISARVVVLAAMLVCAVAATGAATANAAGTRPCGSYSPGSGWYATNGHGVVRWVTAKRVSCSGARALVEAAVHGKVSCQNKKCDRFMAPGDWYCVSKQTGYEAGTTTCEGGTARVRWHSQA